MCFLVLFLMFRFKPAFFTLFHPHQRLFSSSLVSAIRVESPAYLRLLLFLPVILSPAFDSSSLIFHMMYTACKLNKQGDNIQTWHTTYSFTSLEPVCCSVSSSNCCFLTCIQASQEAGQVVWYSRLFKNFPQFVVIYTIKGCSVVIDAEVDVFLKVPCFLYDPMNVDNLISGSSAFSK